MVHTKILLLLKIFKFICVLGWGYFSITTPCYAQIENYPAGARALAMGNTAVTFTDPYALVNNVGGLAGVKQMGLFGTYDNRFGINALQTFNLGFVMPVSVGVWGANLSRFGNELYSEQKIGLGFSHQLGLVSLGAKVNFVQVSIKDWGSSSNFVFEFGGVAQITPQLQFGAHIYNFSLARLRGEYDWQRIPVILKTGLAYRPIQALLLTAEVEQDVIFPTSFKAGVEYEIAKRFYVRTGIQTRPFNQFFGVGMHLPNWTFGYALTNQAQLGLSHHVSLVYTFIRPQDEE